MYILGRKIQLHPKLPQRLFWTIIVLILLGTLTRIAFLAQAQNAVQAQLFKTSIGVSFIIEHFTYKKSKIVRERDELQQRAANLAIDQSELEITRNRIEELETLLQYKNSIAMHTTPARIIARGESESYQIIIDKGKDDGITEGLAAVIENGHILGIIKDVRKTTSVIQLIQHPDTNIPATLLGTGGTIGLVEGNKGFIVRMKYIPQEITVNTSTVVVSSGLDGNIPAGIVIGQVENIHRNETAAFQEADIKPFFDPNKYTDVLILNPTQ